MDFITLQNADGKKISVRFREFQPSDAAEIVNLIRDEYGEKYHKRNLYDTDYIIRQNSAGALILTNNFQHSYDRDDNLKLTLGIMIRKVSKHDAGKIYLPVEQIDIAQKIYSALKVKCEKYFGRRKQNFSRQ